MPTSLIAGRYNGGIALGSDGRSTVRESVPPHRLLVNNDARKVAKIDENLFAAFAGSAATSRELAVFLPSHTAMLRNNNKVEGVISHIQGVNDELLRSYEERYLFQPRPIPPAVVSVIIMGYPAPGYDPVLCLVRPRGEVIHRDVVCAGSGSRYLDQFATAPWLQYSQFRTLNHVIRALVFSIVRAWPYSGGTVRVLFVKSDGSREWVRGVPLQPMEPPLANPALPTPGHLPYRWFRSYD